MRIAALVVGLAAAASAFLADPGSTRAAAPYPPSGVITGITWDTATYRWSGAGGDIWPVTWASDGSIRTAWGDGQLGCGSKVTWGMGAVWGPPKAAVERVACGPSGTGRGKILSLLAHGSRLYAIASLENRTPFADFAVWASDNGGRSWQKPGWVFSGNEGSIRALSFVNYGKAHAGNRDGHVYILGTRAAQTADATSIYLLRVAPADLLRGRASYSYFAGTPAAPAWTSSAAAAKPIFVDSSGVRRPELVRVAELGRYLLTVAHHQPGQLGVFEATEPWGPWRTVSYRDNWLGMANSGSAHFLGVRFPTKWMSDGGRTLWAVFSCHNQITAGACGRYHDRFNLMRARLTVPGR